MVKKYLFLDVPYLCYRVRYATRELSYDGQPTGVIYGFLQSLAPLQDMFRTSNFIFCFDGKKSKRKLWCSDYKATRRNRITTNEDAAYEKAFRQQVWLLQTEYLPTIGFRNVFGEEGYESDDIIASVCKNLSDDEEGVIVSADNDLYQLLDWNVSLYDPRKKKILTLQGFTKQYGIKPCDWVWVKCVAGCPTDNIPGIKGVGIKTAIKYLRGQLSPKSRAFQAIESMGGQAVRVRNMTFIKLPLAGTPHFTIREDELTEEGWRVVTDLLGMKSIRNKMPFTKRL